MALNCYQWHCYILLYLWRLNLQLGIFRLFLNLNDYDTSATTLTVVFTYAEETRTLIFTVKEECKYEVVNCVFINGRLVDIDQDAPFPLTFNISDIKDLNARKGNKSKTITLPGTRNNTSLMLSVYTLSATDTISGTDSDFVDFDPSIKAEAQYYQNGLLEFNGVAQLMSCKLMDGVWSFDITLVSDTIDYISRLAKIKVNELGFSEYNHALIYDNQQDTWNGIIQLNGSPSSNQDSQGWTGRGYYYGLIDYGFPRPSASTFGVEHIPPQVFCYEVLKKAFDYAGITWDSNLE